MSLSAERRCEIYALLEKEFPAPWLWKLISDAVVELLDAYAVCDAERLRLLAANSERVGWLCEAGDLLDQAGISRVAADNRERGMVTRLAELVERYAVVSTELATWEKAAGDMTATALGEGANAFARMATQIDRVVSELEQQRDAACAEVARWQNAATQLEAEYPVDLFGEMNPPMPAAWAAAAWRSALRRLREAVDAEQGQS